MLQEMFQLLETGELVELRQMIVREIVLERAHRTVYSGINHPEYLLIDGEIRVEGTVAHATVLYGSQAKEVSVSLLPEEEV